MSDTFKKMLLSSISGPISSILNTSAEASTGTGTIQDIFPEAIAEYDMGDADTYTSGQTLFSLIENPYDGSDQSAYEYWRGLDGTVNSNDPQFSTNKFILDSNAYFTNKDPSATTWLNKHIDTTGVINGGTILFVFSFPASFSVDWHAMFGANWLSSDYGVLFTHDLNSVRTFISTGSGLNNDLSTVDGRSITNKLVALTWDSNVTTNNLKAAVASASWQETQSVNFGDQSGRSISGAGENHFMGVASNAGNPQSGTLLGSAGDVDMFYAAFIDKFMSDADLAAAVDYIEDRTGLTIT